MSEKIFNDLEREFIREELLDLDLRPDIEELLEDGLMTEEELIEYGILTKEDLTKELVKLEYSDEAIIKSLRFRFLTLIAGALELEYSKEYSDEEIIKGLRRRLLLFGEKHLNLKELLKFKRKAREKLSRIKMTKEEIKERIRKELKKEEEDLELIKKSKEMTINLIYKIRDKIIEGELHLYCKECQND